MAKKYFVAVPWPDEHDWQQLRRGLHADYNKRLGIGVHLTLVRPFCTEQLESCRAVMIAAAAVTATFEIQTDRLGSWPGNSTAVFVRVKQNNALLQLHKYLTDGLQELVEYEGSAYQRYEPHLTLINRVSRGQSEDVMDKLGPRDFQDQRRVASFTLYVKAADPENGLLCWVPVETFSLRDS